MVRVDVARSVASTSQIVDGRGSQPLRRSDLLVAGAGSVRESPVGVRARFFRHACSNGVRWGGVASKAWGWDACEDHSNRA